MAFDTAAYLAARQAGNNQMAAGITSAGTSISTAIEKAQKDSKRLKALRGAATDIFGLDPAKVDQMSSDDIEQHMSGLVLKSSLDKRNLEAKRAAAELEDQQNQQAAYGDFMKGINPEPAGGVGPPAPLDAGRFLAASQKSGYRLAPSELVALMRENKSVNWSDVAPHEFEIGGQKGAVGKSGQFQFLPQNTPDSLQAIPVYDSQGNVVGQRVPTRNGGNAALPEPKGNKELSATFFDSLAHQDGLPARIAATKHALAQSDEQIKALKMDPTQYRAQKKLQLEQHQGELATLFDSMQSEGIGKPETWSKLRKQYNLSAPAARATPAASNSAGSGAAGRPQTGAVIGGYKFKGGDPANKENWEKQ